MRNAIIIILIIVLVGGVILYFGNENKKKLDAQRKVLNGMTCKEFSKLMTEKWKAAYIEGQVAWLKDTDPTYDWENVMNREDIVTNSDASNWITTQTTLSAEGSYSTGVNPMNVAWALDYWLPLTLAEMNIDINKPTIRECLRTINTKDNG